MILQPENLLLDAYGNLKISDFGLSALSQQVRVMTICLHSIEFKISKEFADFVVEHFVYLNYCLYAFGGSRMMDSFIHLVELRTMLLLRFA